MACAINVSNQRAELNLCSAAAWSYHHLAFDSWGLNELVPSGEQTYPLPLGTFEDDEKNPQVGYDMWVSWRVVYVQMRYSFPDLKMFDHL